MPRKAAARCRYAREWVAVEDTLETDRGPPREERSCTKPSCCRNVIVKVRTAKVMRQPA